MKIDFIVSSLGGGGAERVVALMVNSLAKNKANEISVITWFGVKDKYELNPSIKRVVLNQNRGIPSHTLRSIFNLFKYYRSKEKRPDIIVSLITLTNLIAILVAKFYQIRIIAQEHNSHLRYMKGREWISKFTKKYVYKRADVLTVLTVFDIEYYKKYGVNVRVMPNPCSFKSLTENMHNRDKTILAVGNLNRYHHKGFDNLINLIAPILQNNLDWNLKIAGAGNDGMRYLNNLVDKHNLNSQIVFTGFVNNISDLMYQSSIFILSSRFEGLPMVLLEAMSQGMTCISFDCKTGPSDIIKDNVNGLLIKDQDLKEMQLGLNKLIKNEQLRKRLSSNAIKSIENFDIEVITEQYESLFNEIIEY
ncbi:glycosyltransferase family 4 protein [Winogradskyella aurantia]|uniref:Group 1 glycosyl transferase n=1 Tax=Winogradskyella aurantia TaxID=1915063 RepID=A0A265UTA0_9FLAO|nr:glycosyltransferase family 4 protein [Winogradskyella aurantia]OZV68531.1 group 1 glycosyl transferase [Winogradskyella aurantia]